MTIGASLALMIIGAILAYAVDVDVSGVDIRIVGIILILGGLVGLVIGLVRIASARRRAVPPPNGPVYEERVYDERPATYEEPPTRRRTY